MALRQGARPGATPGNRTNFHRPCASMRDRVSKTQFARGSTETSRQFSRGRGRQVMHLPCKQAHAGALPADSTNFNCGENEIQASLISSASVGATPTPATNLGRCSGCRSVKPVSQITVGSDDWSITSTSHHFGSVAQLAEQPVVCGKAEGASPFGSAIFSERSSVFRAPGLGPGGRR